MAATEPAGKAVADQDPADIGRIRYEIKDVAEITPAGIYSSTTEVRGVPWCLKVKKVKSSVHIYLCYRGPPDSNFWTMGGSCELSLANLGAKGEPLDKTFNGEYDTDRKNWGMPDYIEYADLIDEAKGYVKGNKIVIEAKFWFYNITGFRSVPRPNFTDPAEPCHDVALVIEGEKVYVSKQMLGLHSPFFKTLFYSAFDEKDKKEIELKDIKRKDFIDLLHIIYPTPAKVADTNAVPLLKLADQFQMVSVIDRIEQTLVASDNLEIPAKLKLADDYRLVRLHDHCISTFTTVASVKDFKATESFRALSDKAKIALMEKAIKLA